MDEPLPAHTEKPSGQSTWRDATGGLKQNGEEKGRRERRGNRAKVKGWVGPLLWGTCQVGTRSWDCAPALDRKTKKPRHGGACTSEQLGSCRAKEDF